jgi:hypothetical protein
VTAGGYNPTSRDSFLGKFFYQSRE